MLSIVTVGRGRRENNYIPEGEFKNVEGTIISFNNPDQGVVQLMEKDGDIMINSPFDGQYISMEGQQMGVVTDSALLDQHSGKIKANESTILNHRALYTINNTSFIIPKTPFKGKTVYYKGDKTNPMDKNLLDIIQLELSSGNECDTLLVKGGKGVTGFNKTAKINGLNVSLGFGSKILYTPFSLRCDIECEISEIADNFIGSLTFFDRHLPFQTGVACDSASNEHKNKSQVKCQ